MGEVTARVVRSRIEIRTHNVAESNKKLERALKTSQRLFDAAEAFFAHDIADHADDKKLVGLGIKNQFRGQTGIGATKDDSGECGVERGIQLKLMVGTVEDRMAVRALLAEANGYYRRLSGKAAQDEEAGMLFEDCPPGKTREDKRVWGLYRDGRLLGCLDLILGYPRDEVGFLGLLLLADQEQGKGFGRMAFGLMLQKVRAEWPHLTVLRLAVISLNQEVVAFWERVGFQLTGEERSYDSYGTQTTALLMELTIQNTSKL